jgi:hypothetical protein
MSRLRRLWIVSAVGVLGGWALSAPQALAATTTVHAYEDVEAENHFTLTFFGNTPEENLVTTSKVVATRLSLDVDEDTGTARFSHYYQIVEPLTLPLGISTGDIIVQIKTSSGTYDRDTGDFTTHDEYEISFTNDLSFFGFTSPVIIPSESHGNLNGGPSSARTIGMTWEGDGELPNSADPSNPYQYTYVCTSTSKIADPATFPPLPALSSASGCGAGLCGVTGLLPMLGFAVGLAAMKVNVARRRTRR